MKPHHTLIISQGDPAGIGPEVIVGALDRIQLADDQNVIVVGYPSHFDPVSPGLDSQFVSLEEALKPTKETRIRWAHAGGEESWGDPVPAGRETDSGSRAAIQALETATTAVIDSGGQAGICTAPIHKANLARAGYGWPGHTEFLAARAGVTDFAMMLAIPGLRVVPATIHVALRDVPDLISTEGLTRLIHLIHRSMADFGVSEPRIAVTGLNPHAGEEGRFGREEPEIVLPAIESCKRSGIHVTGPYPADTVFHHAVEGAFDVVIAMYHDQALIPIKTLNFHGGVNVTLGLPFVRTSPDHGTAYDLAGKGRADPRSMIAAIEMGFELLRHRGERSSQGVPR